MMGALAFLMGFLPCLSIAGANAAWVLFALLWVARLVLRREKCAFPRTSFDRPILFFLAVWLAGSLLGIAPLDSLRTFPSGLRFVLFYLLVWAEGGKWTGSALRGAIWGAAVSALYGLGQFALWHFIYRAGPPAWFMGLGDQAGDYIALHNGRVHGAVHPLTYAENLLPGFFFFTALFLNADRWKKASLWLMGTAVIGISLILAQSRGPWLAALAGGTWMAAVHPRRLRMIVPLALLLPLLFFHPGMRRRAASITRKHWDKSAVIRLTLWQDGLYIFRQRPFFGVGPGQLKKMTAVYKDRPDFPPNPYGFESDMHNQYLQYLAERGIFGLLAFLLLFGTFLFRAWGLFKRDGPKAVPLALMAVFIALPIFNLTERAFDDAEVAMLIWVLAAALEKPPSLDLSRYLT